eukprot:scaffold69348_cov96-Phaeocystis_antarctica.AAC.2
MSCAGHVTVMKAPPRLQRLHVSRTSSGLLQLLNCSSCFRSSCVHTGSNSALAKPQRAAHV